VTTAAKVVVTGSSGHIGFHVASKLLRKGYQVHLLIRNQNVLTTRLEAAGASVHIVDLSDEESYLRTLRGSAAVFHLAAVNTTSQKCAARIIDSIVTLTRQVVRAAIAAEVETIVYTSSVVVLGRTSDPNKLITENDLTASAESPYVRAKSEAEAFCREQAQAGVDLRIVYPSWVVGPDDAKCTPPHKVILDFVRKGQPFYFAGGISIAHVEDVAEGHVAAFESGKPGGRYLLGGNNLTFRDFFRLLAGYSGHRAPAFFLPKGIMMPIARVAKAACRLVDQEPPLDPAYLEAIVGNYSWYDSNHAITHLGYRIRPLDETLREAVVHARMRILGTYPLNLKLAGKKASAPPAHHDDGVLLITGTPGWLGNRMIDLLLNGDSLEQRQAKRKVRLLVHPSVIGMLQLPDNCEIFSADINDRAALRKALSGVRSVFHLAGAIYPSHISTLYTVNSEGTRNLVDACIESGVRRILYMSTDSVCGHGTQAKRVFDEHTPPAPYRHYGRSKWLGEDYLLRKTAEGLVDGTSLRAFWFFGPYAPLRQLNFVRMFNWPRQLVFGNGKNLRSISHVDNIVQAFLAAENEPGTHGKWYWIGDDQGGYTVDEIYQTIATALGRAYQPLYVPVAVCRLLGLLDDFLANFGRLHPAIHAASKFHFDIAGTSAAAARDFGYKPNVSLADAAVELRGSISR